MPTTLPRHLITETPEVKGALDVAARRWPELAGSRAKLLVRLVEAGRQSLDDQTAHRRDERRAALERTSGALTGAYGPRYLDELRDDWPE